MRRIAARSAARGAGAAFALMIVAAGCQTPAGTGAKGPQIPAVDEVFHVDPARVQLTLDQIPDDPPAPAEVDRRTLPPMPQPAFRRFNDAKTLYQDGRYAEAVLELENALRYDEKQFDVQRLLALSCYLSGSEARARLRAREALKLDPRDVPSRFVLARLAIKSGQSDEALRELRTALKCPVDPAFPEYGVLVHLHAGLLLDDLGYARAALGQFDAFESSLAALNDAQRAHPELTAILKTGPNMISLRRGRALAMTGDFGTAAQVLKAPAAEAPADVAVQREYAYVLARAGRPDDAISAAEALVRAKSASDESVAVLVSVYGWCGRADRTPDALRRLADEHPDRLDLSLRLARGLIEANRLREATDVLRAAQQKQPGESEPAWMLADILRKQERWADWVRAMADLVAAKEGEAERVRAAAEELPPNPSVLRPVLDETTRTAAGTTNEFAVLYVAGVLAARMGDTVTAERYLRTSIEREPKSSAAAARLGALLAEQYKWRELLDLANAGLKAKPDSVRLEELKGRACDGLDLLETAVSSYRRVVEQEPNNARVMAALADVYERAYEPARAQAVYKDLLAIEPNNIAARERLLRSYLTTSQATQAASQLAELRDRAGATSPVYLRNRATLQFLRNRDQDEYFKTMASIVSAHPDDLPSVIEYARGLIVARRFADAEPLVEGALKKAPGSEELLAVQASLAEKRLDFDAAIAIFGELLRRYPNRETWNWALAQLHLYELRYDDAIAVLEHLADLPQARSRRDTYRGEILEVLQMAKRNDAIEKRAEQWLGEDSSGFTTRHLALRADEIREDYAQMVRRCRAWLKADADNEIWRAALIHGLVELKQYGEAESLILGWIESRPDDTALAALLINVFSASGRYAQAIEWIQSAMDAGSAPDAFALSLYQTQIKARDYDGAIETARALGRRRPGPTADMTVGSVLIQARRFAEAEQLFKDLLERAEGIEGRTEAAEARSEALRGLAFCYQKQGMTELALQRMREAHAQTPLDVAICNDLGYSLADLGRELDTAEAMIRLAVAEQPRQAAYLDSLGWVYYKKGEFADALTWLERSLAQPEEREYHDMVVYDHAGDALWRLGRKDEAIQRWQEALDLADKSATDEDVTDADRRQVAATRAKLAAAKRGDKPQVAPIAAEAPPSTQPAPASATH